jgi:hypothetical protein
VLQSTTSRAPIDPAAYQSGRLGTNGGDLDRRQPRRAGELACGDHRRRTQRRPGRVLPGRAQKAETKARRSVGMSAKVLVSVAGEAANGRIWELEGGRGRTA